MDQKYIKLEKIPAVIWGPHSDKVYLYVHGQGGNKSDTRDFASIAIGHGYQVFSIDLPEHGERQGESISFEPWNIVPELSCVMEYCKQQWGQISLFANSIGAWFSMLAFPNENLKQCLFVSPVVDMVDLIFNMLAWANVSELQLKQEKIIPTTVGQTLSWEYLLYAQKNPIKKWNIPTKILYGGQDNLIGYSVIEKFSQAYQCDLTIMKDGEHWFHTKRQLGVLFEWANRSLQTESSCQNNSSVYNKQIIRPIRNNIVKPQRANVKPRNR